MQLLFQYHALHRELAVAPHASAMLVQYSHSRGYVCLMVIDRDVVCGDGYGPRFKNCLRNLCWYALLDSLACLVARLVNGSQVRSSKVYGSRSSSGIETSNAILTHLCIGE